MNVNTTKRTINKSKKNVYKPTLDVQHNSFLNTIQEMTAKRAGINEEIRAVEKKIKEYELSMRECEVVDDATIKQYTALKDKKLDLQDELHRIDSEFNEQQYYTNTASILFEYYDLVEKGNNCESASASAVPSVVPPPSAPKPAGTMSILDFFNKPTANVHSAPSATTTSAATTSQRPANENRDGLTSGVAAGAVAGVPAAGTGTTKTRGALLTKYMKYTDPEYARNANLSHQCVEESCAHCGSGKVMVMTNDGYTWCTNCDAIEYIIIDHEKPSYRDPPKEISFFAYKRSNHLNEWISQIQGKETTEIPEEVYDKILLELRKQRITNMAEVTEKKIKSILKTLGINKYYEHSVHIINRLTGVPTKQLSPELEEQLRNMFKMIQTPFLKHAPKSRKNFLSYSFVLHKLIQLLGQDEYLDKFMLLRSREKLYQQDVIWQKICKDLNWEFCPSL